MERIYFFIHLFNVLFRTGECYHQLVAFIFLVYFEFHEKFLETLHHVKVMRIEHNLFGKASRLKNKKPFD
jgi:hypothetical protein